VAKHFETIFKSGKIKGYNAGDVIVRDFLRDKAINTRLKTSQNRILESKSAKKNKVETPTPGKMLFYHYDAKYKDVLPYWDRFPVIFVIEIYKDSFIGLNMHYLPFIHRARLMDALYETITDSRYDSFTKLKVNYQILKSASRFRYFQPCIKKYLFSHIRSNLIEIPIDEWDYVCFLPLAKFVGASQRKIWDDSINKVMGF